MSECTLESMPGPKGSDITYYRCTEHKCKDREECLFYLVLDKLGKIVAYGCECAKVDFPGPGKRNGGECERESSGEIPGDEGRKFYYRCKKIECEGKGKSCILWIKTKDGEYVDSGCDCKIWTGS